MGEVRIHLKDIVISVLQGPGKAREISRSQPQFSAAFQQVQGVGEALLHAFHYGCGAVRGTIVNDQYMELAFQIEYGFDDVLDVLPLVIGGNDD